MKECQCEIVQNHVELYGIPTLQALGFEEGEPCSINCEINSSSDKEHLSQWPGGETQALERMHAKFSEQTLFKRRNTNSRQQAGRALHTKLFNNATVITASTSRQVHNTDLEPETTGLSAYLNFGALSVRTLWHSAATLSADHEQTMSTAHGQLLYREFFYCAASQVVMICNDWSLTNSQKRSTISRASKATEYVARSTGARAMRLKKWPRRFEKAGPAFHGLMPPCAKCDRTAGFIICVACRWQRFWRLDTCGARGKWVNRFKL